MGSKRNAELKLFFKPHKLSFKDWELANRAFIHRSYAHEVHPPRKDNERLEFLGDSVLGLVVAEYLFIRYPRLPEGELARIKSVVVSAATLADCAAQIGVPKLLLIGKGEEMSGGRSKKALLADAMEAIIGAIFLDRGYPSAKTFILNLLQDPIEAVRSNQHQKDYKSLLQELVQKRYKTHPRYRVIEKTGPDHDRTYTIEVIVDSQSMGRGKGHSKKEAEQLAAQVAYEKIHN